MKTILPSLAIALVVVVPSARVAEGSAERADDGPAFAPVDPAAVGIDLKALERLKARAEATGSDAVVVVKDGRLVADWDFGKPRGGIEAMSATKSIVNLAVGRLIGAGKIKSLDQPVCDFYPEWRQGRKRKITIRHLLNHTSGLQQDPDEIIYDSPDSVRLALAAELSDDPGAKFSYSNKAVNLLAGIIERASGSRMDRFIGEEIFGPMGITDFRWSRDQAGNPYCFAGLEISAIDLAKVGQLVLDEGEWRGRRLLNRDWIRVSTRPSQALEPTCGLLWWLTPRMSYVVDDDALAYFKGQGMTARSLERVEALRGKLLEPSALAALVPIVREDEVLKGKLDVLRSVPLRPKPAPDGSPRAIAAAGHLGQRLTILPGPRLVAVRQRRNGPDVDPNDLEAHFGEFWSMVEALAPGPSPARKD